MPTATTTPVDLEAAFTVDLEAADPRRRTIRGTAVPYGAFGNTSIGPVAFMPGAFGEVNASDVLLVREHDETTPLGRAAETSDDGDRLLATFSVARTTAGDDALVEAAEGLRAGLSVGARATEYDYDEDGRMVVTAAELRHVGLVVRPAYEGARVDTVAASERDDAMPTPTRTDDQQQRQQDDGGERQDPVGVTAAEVDQRIDAAVTRAVDAALEAADNPGPEDPPGAPGNARVVEPEITAAQYARAVVLAQERGDTESERVVEAALAQQTTTNSSGVIPTPLLDEMINDVRTLRPTLSGLRRRPLPEEGMTFELPRWVTKPTTAETAEGVEISTTVAQIDNMSVTVAKIAGGNRVTVETVERSSPAYLEELIDALVEDFRDKSNAYAFGQIDPGRTLADDQHSVGADFVEQYAQGTADSHANGKKVPDISLGGVDKYVALQSAKDTAGRPIFTAGSPTNDAGRMQAGALTGEVRGTRFALETDAAAGDLILFPSRAVNYYEQPGAPFTVRMMQVSTLEWEVAVYGFLAVAVKHPKAVRWLTDTEPAA